MVNYQDGKVYVIKSPNTDKCYIGSTTKKYLSQRMEVHRYDHQRYLDGKRWKITSFEIFEAGDAYITLLENFPCNSIDELHARERWYIENYDGNVVNKVHPTRTRKQWDQDNMDHIKSRNKKYRESNLAIITEKQRAFYAANKETINARRRAQYAAKKLA